MEEQSAESLRKKDLAAAWVSRHPLSSVIGAAFIAFFLGVSAGAGETTEPVVGFEELPAATVADELEAELRSADAALTEAESSLSAARSEASDLRKDKAALRSDVAAKQRQLGKLRRALKSTKRELAGFLQPVSAPVAVSAPAPSSGGSCDSNYTGACVPIVSYDLNCSDISGSVRVVGTDRHGFDGDGDGVGCE